MKISQTAIGIMMVLVPALGYMAYGIAASLFEEHPLTTGGWGEMIIVILFIAGAGWFIYAAIQGMQEMEDAPETVTHNGEMMLKCIGTNPQASRIDRKVTLYLGENHIAYTPSWREKIVPWHEIRKVTGTDVPTFHFANGKTLTLLFTEKHFISVIRALEKHKVQIEQPLLAHTEHLEGALEKMQTS